MNIFFSCKKELLISGLPTIDIDDWERHAAYAGVREHWRLSLSCSWFLMFLKLFVGLHRYITASGMVLGYREDVIARRYCHLSYHDHVQFFYSLFFHLQILHCCYNLQRGAAGWHWEASKTWGGWMVCIASLSARWLQINRITSPLPQHGTTHLCSVYPNCHTNLTTLQLQFTEAAWVHIARATERSASCCYPMWQCWVPLLVKEMVICEDGCTKRKMNKRGRGTE